MTDVSITETTFASKTYLVWRQEVEIKNVMDPQMWQTAYAKVHEYIQKNNLKISGPGSALYFQWDEPTGKGEMGIGNPVEGASSVTDGEVSLVPVAESKAVIATVHGSYDKLKTAHDSLKEYMKEHNLVSTLTIEEYVVTGMDKPNPDEWQTNIYYLYN